MGRPTRGLGGRSDPCKLVPPVDLESRSTSFRGSAPKAQASLPSQTQARQAPLHRGFSQALWNVRIITAGRMFTVRFWRITSTNEPDLRKRLMLGHDSQLICPKAAVYCWNPIMPGSCVVDLLARAFMMAMWKLSTLKCGVVHPFSRWRMRLLTVWDTGYTSSLHYGRTRSKTCCMEAKLGQICNVIGFPSLGQRVRRTPTKSALSLSVCAVWMWPASPRAGEQG